jgi:hypothetical protein
MADDHARFERLVGARELLVGDATPLSNRDPQQALGRIWKALGTAGTDQAYIVTDAAALLPAHRKRVEPIPGAPPLFEWARHTQLLESNNIVLFLVETRASVRSELLASAVQVHVDIDPSVPIEQVVALAHLQEDVSETPAPEAPVRAEAPPAPATDVDPIEALRPVVQHALVHALVQHPEGHRGARIPVMDAVAAILAERLPHRLGTLTFTLSDEGDVLADGDGADWFQATWRGDIALDAAGGMLINALRGGFSEQEPPALDETALTALTKRIHKIVARES